MLSLATSDDSISGQPSSDPAAAAKFVARLGGVEPAAALIELGALRESVKGASNLDESVRSEILSLIQHASEPHAAALLLQFLAHSAGKQATGDPKWNAVFNHEREMAGALCGSATAMLKRAAAEPSLRPVAEAAAARSLRACRMFAKICLVGYFSVPPKLWRLAYTIHAESEKAGGASTSVRMHAVHRTATSPTQELLRLLMLQSSAPDMMSPEQIEAADRVIEQLGSEFTLRPLGATDNVFCFDPSGDQPPVRAGAQAERAGNLRYFGAGLGLDSLQRLYRQLSTARSGDLKVFGKDIAPHAQISAIEHLIAFWGEACPYTPPARTPEADTLEVVSGFAPAWLRLSHSGVGAGELTLLEAGDEAPQPAQTWALQDVGGNELGAEIPPGSKQRIRCGDIVAVSRRGEKGCSLAVIRSMHADKDHGLRARLAIVSRDPRAVQLRALVEQSEEGAVYVGEAARQFDFNGVRAIILSDGSHGAPAPNFLLPPDGWKADRVYEATLDETAHYLRGVQLLRRGDDYVRATFEWVQKPAQA